MYNKKKIKVNDNNAANGLPNCDLEHNVDLERQSYVIVSQMGESRSDIVRSESVVSSDSSVSVVLPNRANASSYGQTANGFASFQADRSDSSDSIHPNRSSVNVKQNSLINSEYESTVEELEALCEKTWLTRTEAKVELEDKYGLFSNKPIGEDIKYRGGKQLRLICNGCDSFCITVRMKRLRLPGTEENVSKFFVIKEKSSLDHVCCDPEKIKYDIAVASPLGLGSSSASSSSLPVMEDVTMAENNFISINGMSRETAPISQTLKRRISVSSHRGSTMCGPTASKELSHYQSMSPVAQPIAANNLAQPIASNNVRSALGGSSSLMNTLHSMNAGGGGSNGINAIAHFANYTPQSLAQQPAAVQAFNESVAQHNLGGGLSSVSSSLPPPSALSNLPSSTQRGNDSDSSNSDDEDDLTMAQTLSAHVQQQSIEGSSSASLPLTADIINHNNINNGHGLSHSQQLYLMDNRNAAARNNVPPLSRVSIYSQPHGLEHQIESYHMMTGDAVSGPLLLKGRRTEIEPQRVDQSHLAVEDRSWITRSEAKADLENKFGFENNKMISEDTKYRGGKQLRLICGGCDNFVIVCRLKRSRIPDSKEKISRFFVIKPKSRFDHYTDQVLDGQAVRAECNNRVNMMMKGITNGDNREGHMEHRGDHRGDDPSPAMPLLLTNLHSLNEV